MIKLSKLSIVFVLLVTVASAAVLSEYLRDDRTVEVAPWMTVEVNNDPINLTYGDVILHDFINISSHKQYSTTCEIETTILFNDEELIDQEGIIVNYHVEAGDGSLVLPKDTNNNSLPEAAIFGTQDADGIFTIRRNILLRDDLVPGTYKIVTVLIPYK